MPRWLTLDNSFDLIAAVIATACFAAVLGTFVIGKHYIIPTFWLAIALLFANLARHGLAGARWAKQILGHIGLLASANLFMGLFFAKTPKELLGGLFLPAWGLAFLIVAGLTWQYVSRNALLRSA